MPADSPSPVNDESERGEAGDDMSGPRHHIVLSPHYDDMALSIGATMAAIADAGRSVTDLIVFGAEPTGVPLHAFARHHHEAWGLTTNQVIAARKAEEQEAVGLLGASTANLTFFDAIYRSDYYQSDDQLFGTPSPAEANLPSEIAAAARHVAGSLIGSATSMAEYVRFYAPMGIGSHVDHQLAFLAGRNLQSIGYVVWFYEDLPYALIGDNRNRRLASLALLGCDMDIVALGPIATGWQRKIQAVLAYPSQLETVFRNYAGVEPTPEAINDALASYHRSIGAGQSAERFWAPARRKGSDTSGAERS